MSGPAALPSPLADAGYRDPVAQLDWRGVDRECWWLPPDALSLAGVPQFEALPLAVRRALSHYEFVHVLDMGLWLEALFIQRIAAATERTADKKLRARYLEEIREEAGHSLMFLELMDRSGVLPPAPSALRRASGSLSVLLPAGSALFWALTAAGEELSDRITRSVRRASEEVVVSAVVFHISRLHGSDEARHIAFARAQCAEATRALAPWQRRLLSPLLDGLLELYVRTLCYPPAALYAAAGLAPGSVWRARAKANPRRRAMIAQWTRPTREFLRAQGWRLRARGGHEGRLLQCTPQAAESGERNPLTLL